VEREEEKAQEEESQEEEMKGSFKGSINLGLAAEIVGIVREFNYKQGAGYVTTLYDTKEDIADVLQTFFATGRIDYPRNPQERKVQLEENPPIPIEVFNQIERYIEHRVAPQTFVLYCLHDDRVMATRVGYGDFTVREIDLILAYIQKRAPAESWGSIEKVVGWLNEPGYLDDSSRR